MSKTWLAAAAVGFCAVSGAAQACPSFANQGNEVYDVVGTVTPTGFSVVAGGNFDTEFCPGINPVNAPSAHGFVIAQPDFSFLLSGAPGSTVAISTSSPNASCDTVLLANTPTTDWYFNDDTSGLQSYIEMPNVPEGRLDVWVGTFDGSFCDTNLIIEVVGAAPASGGAGDDKPEVVAEEPATTTEASEPVVEETAPEAEPDLPEAPTPGGAEDTPDAPEASEAAPVADQAAPTGK